MSNSDLSTTLRSLVNSLAVSQTKIGVLSDNIANVGTEGYTRKTLSQESVVADGVVLGVDANDIRRSIDEFLVAANRDQLSEFGEAEIKNDFYERIQQFTFGDPNSSFTINNTLNQFYSRLDDFANDPSSAVKKSLAISAAEDFANSITNVSDSVYNERLNAEIEIKNTISELNGILDSLGDINEAIRENASIGGQTGGLLDARDVELNKLKEIIDADISFNEFDQVSIKVSSAELLGGTQRYVINYERLSSVDELKNNIPTNAITITALDNDGNLSRNVETLLSASNATRQVDEIPGGKLRGLLDLRDINLPTITDQLDNFVINYADAFNEVHNDGTGFPPPQSLTGTEVASLNDEFLFEGSFRLAALDANGNPIQDRYGDDLLPLEIDFDEFNGAGSGTGTFTVSSLINEINSYYSVQSSKSVNVGDAKNIKVASTGTSVTSAEASGTMSFSSQPTAGDTIIVNGISYEYVANGVTPVGNQIELGLGISGTINNTLNTLNGSTNASISLATYSVGNGSIINIKHDDSGSDGNSFTIDTSGSTAISASGATLTGGANVSGTFDIDFEFTNLNALGEQINFDVSSYTINYDTYSSGAITPIFNSANVDGGARNRTDNSLSTAGGISLDLTDAGAAGLREGETFTVDFVVSVTDESGNVSNETITYTFTAPDPDTNIINTKYGPSSISGTDGELVLSSSNNGFLKASLVDANGNEITNGSTEGFLKIETAGSNIRFSIDQLDSAHAGNPTASDIPASATGKGISHFFGMNNFFTYGGEEQNASVNLDIRSDIKADPSKITSGRVQLSTQTGSESVYTYEIGAGSNSIALDLITLQNDNIFFESAGGLPELSTTINAYITEIYNSASLKSNSAETEYNKQILLTESLQNRIDDISGVNIDQELALTIQVQNSYSASASVINIVRELFDKLEEALL